MTMFEKLTSWFRYKIKEYQITHPLEWKELDIILDNQEYISSQLVFNIYNNKYEPFFRFESFTRSINLKCAASSYDGTVQILRWLLLRYDSFNIENNTFTFISDVYKHDYALDDSCCNLCKNIFGFNFRIIGARDDTRCVQMSATQYVLTFKVDNFKMK